MLALLRKKYFKGDPYLWRIILTLAFLGIGLVYSARSIEAFKAGISPEYYLMRQLFFVLVGLAVMWVVHQLDYHLLEKLSGILLLVSIPLLLYARFFGQSEASGGASRWIHIFGLSFMPADLAKFALYTHLAYMLALRFGKEYTQDIVMPIVIKVGFVGACIAMTGFSTSVIVVATCFLVMAISGVPWRLLKWFPIVVIPVGGIGAFLLGQREGTIFSRTEQYWDMLTGKAIPDQLALAFVGITNGQWTGLGGGHSIQRNVLSQNSSDFMFATLVEEYGFLFGALPVIILYVAFFYRSLIMIERCKKPFGIALATALTISLVIQAFVHICVNVGLVPVTGQTLPLLSTGGTSMIFTFLSMGILLSISRNDTEKPLP